MTRFNSKRGMDYDYDTLKKKKTNGDKAVEAKRDEKKESSEEPQAFICWAASQEVQVDVQMTSTEFSAKFHQFTIARFVEVTMIALAAEHPLTVCLQCHSASWTNPHSLTCVKKKVPFA